MNLFHYLLLKEYSQVKRIIKMPILIIKKQVWFIKYQSNYSFDIFIFLSIPLCYL